MQAPRLELDAISKSFGTTRALDGVSLALFPGECHVLAGENGAGKSTLIRILSGVYADYGGEVRLEGRPVRLGSPAGTTRGFGVTEFRDIGDMIADVFEGLRAKGEEGDPAVEADVKARVRELCARFPIYPER